MISKLQDVLQKLSDVTQELKETFGNTPDLWETESRIN